jgi:radical SAM protein with 4Fe4S-binding SPASM domain
LSFFTYSPCETGREGGDAHILFHATESKWVKVNDTGLEIARRLEQGASVQDVVFHLWKRYRIADDIARRQVEQVRAQLAAHGFLKPGVVSKPSRSPRLNSIFLHLTNRCNLACVHCYTGNSLECPTKDLPAPLLFRMLAELTDHGGTSVTLSGGEPLLHPNIKEILRRAGTRLDINMLTNGTLIDREWAEFLSDIGVYVQISVDGSCEQIHDRIRGKGSFKKTIDGLNYLQRSGLGDRLNFSTTVMNQNLDDLIKIITLARRLGVPLVRFLPLRRKGTAQSTWQTVGSGLSTKEYARFYDDTHRLHATVGTEIEISCGLSGFLLKMPKDSGKDDIWCPVGCRVVVDFNGDAYPCVLMMEDEFRLGNVFHNSLEEIIQSDAMAGVCRVLVERRRKIEKCAGCTWRNLCQAGCMGQALDNKGTIWDTDDFCDYRKRAYKEAFDRILTIDD